MTARLSPDWLRRPAVIAVTQAFERENLPLRFVGGAVRDALIGRSVTDIDAATPVMPELVLALLEKHGMRAIPTGMAHGTVTAVVAGEKVEITTLRRDVETDGRHAVVAFTDNWRDDAARRDFTINAFYLAPDGRLFDYFGGREDLAAGRVRFIGDPEQRIEEDRLRVLRFFRFHASHGRPPADLAAIGACEAASLGLVHLSGERIRQEMMKLLGLPDPTGSLDLMMATGVLPALLGGPCSLDRVRRLVASRLADVLGAAPIARLAALLAAAADPVAGLAYVIRRWKLSGREADLLRVVVEGDAEPLTPEEASARRLIYRHGQPAALYCLALALAKPLPIGKSRALAEAALRTLPWQPPAFPVSGRDLSERGFPPGPGMGQALAALESHWIDSDFALGKTELLATLPAS